MLKFTALTAPHIMVDYSTKKITRDLIDELKTALKNVRGWGSVEIYVQDFKVTQITERNIKKSLLWTHQHGKELCRYYHLFVSPRKSESEISI